VGDTLKMKGPAGHVIYHGRGRLAINAKPMQIKQISMVAGGTGITPMYQLARAICKDPGDSTQVSLLYANRSTQDILLRHELDELARDYPQFQVWYTVDQRPDQGAWRYSVGHVVEHMLRAQLFPACRDALTLLCGPPAMVELALIPGLESLGYTPEDLFEF
jgi:NAD(P)H-flavin reductase